MGLKGLLVATSLAFALIVFMVVAGPTIAGLSDSVDKTTVEEQGYMGQFHFVIDVVLIYVPTIFTIGIVLYAYAAIQKNESFFGGGLGGGGPR